MSIYERFFPGFAKRAVTFSIDDGNLEMDAKFIDIVKPRGLKGAFNLTSPRLDKLGAQGYRDFYRGFEIANHCKYHPVTIDPADPREFSDKIFDKETADERFYYRHPEVDGLWYLKRHDFWCVGAKYEDYIGFIDKGREEIEAVFGEGSVKGFVWPHGCCYDDRILDHIRKNGYVYTRYTTRRDGDFSMPTDRMRLGMQGRSGNLPEAARAFLDTPDGGELKMMVFGTHSNDYEKGGLWNELCSVADLLGSDSSKVWCATPSEIFAYEDALNALSESCGRLKNPSDVAVHLKIDGELSVIPPHGEITI